MSLSLWVYVPTGPINLDNPLVIHSFVLSPHAASVVAISLVNSSIVRGVMLVELPLGSGKTL
jgi:hypothetical protein